MAKNEKEETYFSFSMTNELNDRFEKACDEMGASKKKFVITAIEEKLAATNKSDTLVSDDIPAIKSALRKLKENSLETDHLVMALARRVMALESKINNDPVIIKDKDKSFISEDDTLDLGI